MSCDNLLFNWSIIFITHPKKHRNWARSGWKNWTTVAAIRWTVISEQVCKRHRGARGHFKFLSSVLFMQNKSDPVCEGLWQYFTHYLKTSADIWEIKNAHAAILNTLSDQLLLTRIEKTLILGFGPTITHFFNTAFFHFNKTIIYSYLVWKHDFRNHNILR